jgi:hypothetical protein
MTKKVTKSKKQKKTKKLNHDQAFNIGWDAEQALADLICSKISDEDTEAADTAFIAAYQGITNRMLHHWKKDMLLDILNEISADVDSEHNESHICNDCMEKHGSAPTISANDNNKVH